MQQTQNQISETAQTIFEQLRATGLKFNMLGVKTMVADEKSLTLKLSGIQKINTVVVKYDEGEDLYTLEFWNCRIITHEIINEKVKEFDGIFWDNMTEIINREVRS